MQRKLIRKPKEKQMSVKKKKKKKMREEEEEEQEKVEEDQRWVGKSCVGSYWLYDGRRGPKKRLRVREWNLHIESP